MITLRLGTACRLARKPGLWAIYTFLLLLGTAGPLPVHSANALPAADSVSEPASPPKAESRGDAIEAEIRETEHTRRFLEDRVHRDAEDAPALDRLASADLKLLRLTGRLENLVHARAAAKASRAALPDSVNAAGLAAMARVEFESHRFAEARDLALQVTTNAPDRIDGFLTLGDALLELGDIAGALDAWHKVEQPKGASLESEVRLARVALLTGKLDEARDGFSHALEMAKAMDPPVASVVIWCLLQRGQLAFGQGDWDGAEKDYLTAQELAPSFFATREHLAELRGAQKRFPEAVLLYRQVIAQTGERPEFVQELGDLQAFAGQGEEAKATHGQALVGYLKSVDEGNAHYFHHLAGFYCDVQLDPGEAVKWAQRDIGLRQSAAAYDTLAWALYQNGQWADAADAARKGLAPGGRDAHALYHAGMILSRAGGLVEGGKLLREVSVVNPRYFSTFHVHR